MRIRVLRLREWIDENKWRFLLVIYVALPLVILILWLWVTGKPIAVASMKEFVEVFGFPMFIVGGLSGGLQWALQLRGAREKQALLRTMQKERISILPRFSPKYGEVLVGKQSIYRSILASLQRANESVEEHKHLVAKLLLCSPALDYPERDSIKEKGYKEWGSEFIVELKTLATNKNSKVDITFLPESSGTGYHPLDDFIQVLSSYCESKKITDSSFGVIHSDIWYSTKNIIDTLGLLSVRDDVNVRRNVDNIPFQIILFRSEVATEAVVSFAGHELLEDVNSSEPVGFFTADAYVVEQLEKVYDAYTTLKRRRPFTPLHSKTVLGAQQQHTGNYVIPNYLALGLGITVCPGSFSPYYGNSSKFTSWVITRVLDREATVLDIGSGTGVQALVAEKTLKSKGGNAPKIYAIECVPGAFDNLQMNIKLNDSSITAVRGVMVACTNFNRHVSAWKMITSDEKAQLENEVSARVDAESCVTLRDGEKIVNGDIFEANATDGEATNDLAAVSTMVFDVVIADLPFCDALPQSNQERAFLDMGHREHMTLFSAINEGKWLAQNGILITSLSSLGGENDVTSFERLAAECGLLMLQKFYFYEGRYMWIVYVFKRKNELPTDTDSDVTVLKDSYWREHLSVQLSKS